MAPEPLATSSSPRRIWLLATTLTPEAAFVVTFSSMSARADDDTAKEDNTARPPTVPSNNTSPVPAVTVRLRDVPSELMVDRKEILPEVAPEETTRLAVRTTGVVNSI